METNLVDEIDGKIKAERGLIVFGNTLDILKQKAKSINPESVKPATEIVRIFEDAMTEAANNGGDVNFKAFADSVGKLFETS